MSRALRLSGGVGVIGAGALTGAMLALAGERMGTKMIVVPALLVMAVALLLNPELLLLVVLAACVLFEFEDPLVPSLSHVLYGSVIKGLNVVDLLVLLLAAAVVLDAHRQRRRLVGAGPLSPALVLLTAATLGGAVTGHYAGASTKEIYEPLIKLSHLILLPLIVVNVAKGRSTPRRFLMLMVVLVAIKSVLGLYIAKKGGLANVEGHSLSYLEPTANWLALLYVLSIAAAALHRVKLPLWAYGIMPFALLSLLISYRRSFWIAAVIGIALVVLIGAGPRGRRVAVPAVTLLAILGTIVLSSAGGTAVSRNPLLARAASLNPSHLTANAEDRYRIDERRDVLANLSEHPITGLGIAVPWSAPHPLSTEHPGGRLYTHMIVLWYWMNLGLMGLLAYAALMLTSLWASYRVWRRHPQPVVRAIGLGLFGSLVGLMAAETTASFTGVDIRLSVVLPIVLGFLVCAVQQTRRGTVSYGRFI
jgi:O-Antigen ligase